MIDYKRHVQLILLHIQWIGCSLTVIVLFRYEFSMTKIKSEVSDSSETDYM